MEEENIAFGSEANVNKDALVRFSSWSGVARKSAPNSDRSRSSLENEPTADMSSSPKCYSVIAPRRTPLSISKKRSLVNSEGTSPCYSSLAGLTPSPIPNKLEDESYPTNSRSSKKLKFEEAAVRPDVGMTFTVLLPNGKKLNLSIDPKREWELEDLLSEIQNKAPKSDGGRKIKWENEIVLKDFQSGKTVERMSELFISGKTKLTKLILEDGCSKSGYFDKHMWDVTPEPRMLDRIPLGYDFNTALADQIDNALQAVWFNDANCRKLVSVEINSEIGTITIFDTGRGMDVHGQNSIANWGTIGSSLHRDVHHRGIGGNPPFLKPYLGKYGAGGVAAALHIGRKAVVRSKTKASTKVVGMVIDKEKLIGKGKEEFEKDWHVSGFFRNMTEAEQEKAPDGSFTCVEISQLNEEVIEKWKIQQLKWTLKDIYSYYIQIDHAGTSSKTMAPVEFELNGENLVEEIGGEITTCNRHSSNGQPFVVDISLEKKSDESWRSMPAKDKAHARITCCYFPTKGGKESLQNAIQEMGQYSSDTFDTLPRVRVRWLGRLLPNTRWALLPFMETEPRKNAIYSQCRKRVKAFADVDAGFVPTQSKTDLEFDHPFTVALKKLGSTPEDIRRSSACGVEIKLHRQGRTISQRELIEAFVEWLKQMHEEYDEEVTWKDEAVIVFGNNIQKELGVERAVVEFHRSLGKGSDCWQADTKIRLRAVLEHGKDFYGTIEYFFWDGTEDDHGEVQMICRPIEVARDNGSIIIEGQEPDFKLNKSKPFVATYLNSQKCQRLDNDEWKKKLKEIEMRYPGSIAFLDDTEREALGIDEEFPVNGSRLNAGYQLPSELFLIIYSRSKKQTLILPEVLKVKVEAIFPHDVYCGHMELQVKKKGSNIFFFKTTGTPLSQTLTKCGEYNFKFYLANDSNCIYEAVQPIGKHLFIVPASETAKWDVQFPYDNPVFRLGERLEFEFQIHKYDKYENKQGFEEIPSVWADVLSPNGHPLGIEWTPAKEAVFAKVETIQFQSIVFNAGNVEPLQPSYEANLQFYVDNTRIEKKRIKVLPGRIASVYLHGTSLLPQNVSLGDLVPGDVIKKLCLECKDTFGNMIDRGQKVQLHLDQIEVMDKKLIREVGEHGYVELNHLLKVTPLYNSKGAIEICTENGDKSLTKITFRTISRSLQNLSEIPSKFLVGRKLENIIVGICDESGKIDDTVDVGHSLEMDWQKNVNCPFTKGKCQLPDIILPTSPGIWSGYVSHALDPGLRLTIQVKVEMNKAKTVIAENKIMEASSGSQCILNFSAKDNQNFPGYLTEEMINNLEFHFDPPRACAFIKCWRVYSTSVPGEYSVAVMILGSEGEYSLLGEGGYPLETGHTLSWPLKLSAGSPRKILPVFTNMLHESEIGENKDILHKITVPRYSKFPALHVYIVDEFRNVCFGSNGLRVSLEASGCPGWRKQLSYLKDGCAQFEAFLVDVDIGNFNISIEVGEINLQESLELVVVHGNYPSELRLESDGYREIKLTGRSEEYLPDVELAVTSADGKPLQHQISLVFRFYREPQDKEAMDLYLEKDYLISLDTEDIATDTFSVMHAGKSLKLCFSRIAAPREAGLYQVQVCLRECAVPQVSFMLKIFHGPPSKMELEGLKSSRALMALEAKLTDIYGNKCITLSDVKLCAEVRDTSHGCHSLLTSCATVQNGVASFEPMNLKSTMEGVLTLKVSVDGEQLNMPLYPVTKEVLYLNGAFEEEVSSNVQELRKYRELISTIETNISCIMQNRKSEQEFLCRLKGLLEKNNEQQMLLQKEQRIAKDDIVLGKERCQPCRTRESIAEEFNQLAENGNTTPLIVWKAITSKEFILSKMEKEFIGQVVMLAKVEAEELNRVLTDYLGKSTLLLIVCKSQKAIDFLEEYDSEGNIVENKGLHGFARSKGYQISSKYQAIALSDIGRCQHSVDIKHHQMLLNIPEPKKQNGEVPTGFIGYAVNLLHLEDEHLNISLNGRSVSLRETLFFYLLKYLQVYDTRQHMHEAKHEVNNFQAISLDGGIVRANFRQELGKPRSNLKVSFPLVPFEERMRTNLLLASAGAFQRLNKSMMLEKMGRRLTEQVLITETQIEATTEKIDKAQGDISSLKAMEEKLLDMVKELRPLLNKMSDSTSVELSEHTESYILF